MKTEHVAAFAILGVDPKDTFNPTDIESAYRRMALTVHPDVCRGPEASRLFRLAANARRLLLAEKPRTEGVPRHYQQPNADWVAHWGVYDGPLG